MSLWLIRAGKHGEYENDFLSQNKVFLAWDKLTTNLEKLKTRNDLAALMAANYPESNPKRILNHVSQLWPFIKEMAVGDWFVLPSKSKPVIHVGEIRGAYTFEQKSKPPLFHSRDVKWIAKDVPRTMFDQDLLYSFGAFMTICKIQRNDAEQRVHDIFEKRIRGVKGGITLIEFPELPSEDTGEDLERLAKDQIAKYLSQKFTGHDLTRLVDAIFVAKGYQTYRSPEGPDMGADILAASGELGFGSPRICVQVKSGNFQVDRPTLDQLTGAMQRFKAEYGLMVSWAGFKSSVTKEEAKEFFRIKFWDQDSLIKELEDNYDKLDESIKVELPLKRIWTMAQSEED